MSIILNLKSTNKKENQDANFISNKICRELEKFFDIKLRQEPVILLLDSRKEIDEIREQKTDNKLVAWFWKQRFIFILKPEKFEKESEFFKNDFDQILKHELSHLFFNQITKTSSPAWLDEGLACYLAGQKYQEDISVVKIEKVMKCFFEFDRTLFGVSSIIVEKLIELKGERVFVDFLRSFDGNFDEEKFNKLFKKYFKLDFSRENLYKLLY